jgi:hypothetical protein
MYYNDLEYAKKRLKDTIVFTNDNQIVYVHDILANWQVHCLNLKSKISGHIPASDIKLEGFKLGLTNITPYAVYVERKPMRNSWKQGLSLGSLRVSKDPLGRFSFPHSLIQTLSENFPKLSTCYNSMKNSQKVSIAFSKDFGIDKDGNLFYRTDVVGEWNKKGIFLKEPFFYLQEHLDKDVANASS